MEREIRSQSIASQETSRMAFISGRIHKPGPHKEPFSSPNEEDGAPFQDYAYEGDNVPGQTKIDDIDNEVLESKEFNREEVNVLSLQSGVRPDYTYKPFEYHLSSISPKEINFSIISSENTRVICSLVIAILVVLSHVNLPHNVVESNSLIAYRPLYALLLTDMLIVAARLALYSEGKEVDDKDAKFEGLGGHNDNNKKKNIGDNNWDGAVKLLEWGLVLHQTVRAVFIDCSFYVAVVVCGLYIV
ncbi:glucose-repressible alcohol dehydrogenasetranscriptional effector [Striga asiatica]|uniref:Glucose-repressible alcohol dehydrogenasetranscriptional effector n=1 Tax=Striga asiatica TaxID=4170 RepID=A0A5A7QFU6_STRAF|nr:glucose-repressible alcohol dehydrogenasetranscriptional effector [Striga asiatica]